MKAKGRGDLIDVIDDVLEWNDMGENSLKQSESHRPNTPACARVNRALGISAPVV